MSPLEIMTTGSGKHELLLGAGDSAVSGLVEQLGHTPNGYFWEGVARWLMQTEAKDLADRVETGAEADTFWARSDLKTLEALGQLMSKVANDAAVIRALLEKADAAGFDFDD